jgi:hypothetical protein
MTTNGVSLEIVGAIVIPVFLFFAGVHLKITGNLRKELSMKATKLEVEKLDERVRRSTSREETVELIRLHIDPIKDKVDDMHEDIKILLRNVNDNKPT